MRAIQPSRTFHLRNWSIGAKLAASFGLIILITIGLADTGLLSLLSVQRTLDEALNKGLQIETLGNRVQNRLSGARRQEQAFLLHWQDEGYQSAAHLHLMPRGSYIADIRRTIVELDNLTADEQTEFSVDINAQSRQLMAALDTYGTEFNLVTDLLMSRGANQSGTIGDLEKVSLELAAELETLGQPELINAFLRLQLNEKQYRLLGVQQYSEQMSLALQELRAALARVAPAESERLISLLERYEQSFEELNRLDAELASHMDRYNAAAEAIHSLAFNIAADGAELADAELDSLAESVQRARIVLVLTTMVAAALSLVLSIVLTRQISRPIRVLTDTAMEIEHGNLDAQAHVESGGEVGMLAAVFNSMTAQLRQTLEDLEQRVAERTAELTKTNEQLQREVVERKRAEEALRGSELQYRTTIDSMDDIVHVVDTDLRFILFNRAFRQLNKELGLKTDVIGRTVFESFPFLPEGVRDEYRQVFDTGEILVAEETTIVGERELVTETRKIPVLEDGRVARVVTVIRDITERKRAERALRVSEERFALAVQGSNDGVWDWDIQNSSLYWSPRLKELLGYADDELDVDFEAFDSHLHPEDREHTGAAIEAHLKDGELYDVEQRLRTKSGQYRWFRARGQALWDEAGRPLRMTGSTTDITERKRAEEQLQRYAAELEQANEEVKQFAYIVSHDLRAPLTNLRGFSEELNYALEVIGSAMDKALPHLEEKQRLAVTTALQEEVPEALSFIGSSVTRMDDFINAVLKLSRLGRRELNPELLNMDALVQAALQTLAYQIEERQVSVTVGPLPEVVADRASMEQILGNLLGNAVKYLDPDRPGEIEISGERGRGETILRVRDNGRGIAEEDMDKVFAPFRRAGRQDVPGEGMGLPYVQTLVRRHGGRIWCESELGVGTKFTFTLSSHLAGGDLSRT
jgi:PAS domain S-box-containing protein